MFFLLKKVAEPDFCIGNTPYVTCKKKLGVGSIEV
jgi:hypothetical protein